MDLVTSCKDKLAYFRIKELKDVLTQLGLSKQGKKQDLVDRILATLSDERVSGMWSKKNSVRKEEVAKLVDDIYRKMQVSGATGASGATGTSVATGASLATDLASKSQTVPDSSNVKLEEEIEDSHHMKMRCVCGSSLQTETLIQCEDRRCHTWQHMRCVIIPEKPMESGDPPLPPTTFYCELCRLGRADPFWVTMGHPLYPAKLAVTSVPADGTNSVQSIEKTFQITRADRDLLAKQEYDLQAWCMLLNDKVQFRMQWPQYADLQVNGVPVRAINRPGSQLLGANGRDDGPIITPCTRDGINKITLTGCDARVFCLGVRLVKRRTVQQVLSMIPKEPDGEQFEDALSRVRRCVGGGAATENADDSDSDLEVVADCIPVNLRCPMSGSRMKVAGRFKPCIHMGCFDLEVFVEMNQRSRKWQCPICLKNYTLEHVVIDPYFNRITSQLRSCGEEVTEIEVKPDGSWRAKTEGGDRRSLGDLVRWHLPDGRLIESPPDLESKPKPSEILKQVKLEGGSDGGSGLIVGLKKNRNGLWEINKAEDQTCSSGSRRLRENFGQEDIIPMSSSATGSGKEGSVNQDGNGNLDVELEAVSLNIDLPTSSSYGLQAGDATAEVIVLSDSEEENEPIIPQSGAVFNNNQGIADSFQDANAGLGLFNSNDDEFGGMNMWSLPSGTAQGFQLFGSSDADALVDVQQQHTSVNCPPIGYEFASSASLLPNDSLVDNPLAFSGSDPSLQIFLPTRPSDATTPVEDTRDQPDVSNGCVSTEDWISLRLGGDGGGDSAIANGLSSAQPKDTALNSLADTASLLLGMNDSSKTTKNSRERSDSPFTFPRQRRSVRPRLYLSIDSDSE